MKVNKFEIMFLLTLIITSFSVRAMDSNREERIKTENNALQFDQHDQRLSQEEYVESLRHLQERVETKLFLRNLQERVEGEFPKQMYDTPIDGMPDDGELSLPPDGGGYKDLSSVKKTVSKKRTNNGKPNPSDFGHYDLRNTLVDPEKGYISTVQKERGTFDDTYEETSDGTYVVKGTQKTTYFAIALVSVVVIILGAIVYFMFMKKEKEI